MIDPIGGSPIPRFANGNFIQIGNLNPALAVSDPEYLPSVISAAVDHFVFPYIQSRPAGISDDDFFKHLFKELIDNHFRFLITTNYPSTARAIRKLMHPDKSHDGFDGPNGLQAIDLTHDPHMEAIWGQMEKDSKGKIKRPTLDNGKTYKMYAYEFTPEKALAIRAFMVNHYHADFDHKVPLARPSYFWWLQGTTGN